MSVIFRFGHNPFYEAGNYLQMLGKAETKLMLEKQSSWRKQELRREKWVKNKKQPASIQENHYEECVYELFLLFTGPQGKDYEEWDSICSKAILLAH